MYDIHSHVIPNIDDGAKSLGEALEMGKIAEKEGITGIIATPHFNFEDPEFKENVLAAVKGLNEKFEEENIRLTLYPGCEVFLNGALIQRLKNQELLTLNGSDYLLVEFPLGEAPYNMEELLYRIRLMGKKPIIAHPERYQEVMDNPNLVKRWVEQGNYIQVNATSILGVSGSRVTRTTKHLFAHKMVHLIATDAHSPRNRSPRLTEAKETAGKWCGKKELDMILANSKRVFDNEELIINDPVQYPYGYNVLQRIHATLRK